MLIINPGTGPVPDATEAHAWFNLGVLAGDLRERGVEVVDFEPGKPDGEGRWSAVLVLADDRRVEVEMPGLAIDRVRYLGEDDQNIWDFPRLYVEGSSWVWRYALGAIADSGDEGES